MQLAEREFLRNYILTQPSFDITKVPGGALQAAEDITHDFYNDSRQVEWYLTFGAFGHTSLYCKMYESGGESWLEPLASIFQNHKAAPVGRAGYSDGTDIGSHRVTLWSPTLAIAFNRKLFKHIYPQMKAIFERHEKTQGMVPIGLTPIFRFMEYKKGGSHNVHHDAPYEYPIVSGPDGQYKLWTSHSVVFFFDTMGPEDGGCLYRYPSIPGRGLHDWTDEERAANLQYRELLHRPIAGSAVIFPHEMAHEVEEYKGNTQRRIIRCDLAVAKKL